MANKILTKNKLYDMIKSLFFRLTTMIVVLIGVTPCFGNSNSNRVNVKNDSLKHSYDKYLMPSKEYRPLSLPFSSNKYLELCNSRKNIDVNDVYPSYQPNDDLITFIKSIDYEGGEYNCFVIPCKSNNFSLLLLHIVRGDGEYYLLMSFNNANKPNYMEVGSGGNTIMSFSINKHMVIEQYSCDGKKVSKYQINDQGEFIRRE